MCEVLLINPPFSKEEEKKHFPTGLGMIGASLKKNKIPYTVFDCDTIGKNLKEDEIFLRIKNLIVQKSLK